MNRLVGTAQLVGPETREEKDRRDEKHPAGCEDLSGPFRLAVHARPDGRMDRYPSIVNSPGFRNRAPTWARESPCRRCGLDARHVNLPRRLIDRGVANSVARQF